jgi:hypothetical protein
MTDMLIDEEDVAALRALGELVPFDFEGEANVREEMVESLRERMRTRVRRVPQKEAAR